MENPFTALKDQARRSLWLASVFYSFYFGMQTVFFTINWGTIQDLALRPTWPVFWLSYVQYPLFYAKFIWWFSLLANLGAMIFPHVRAARILFFVSTFLFQAVMASELSGWQRTSTGQAIPFISFLLIFLPSWGRCARSVSSCWQATLVTILVQISVLSTYGATGLWRLRGVFHGWREGQETFFSPNALAYVIATFQYQTDRIGTAGGWLVNNIQFSGRLMTLGTLLEFSCICILLRPGLYRTWGVLLMLFHLGIMLVLDLPYPDNHLLVALFLVCSPWESWLNRFGRGSRA